MVEFRSINRDKETTLISMSLSQNVLDIYKCQQKKNKSTVHRGHSFGSNHQHRRMSQSVSLKSINITRTYLEKKVLLNLPVNQTFRAASSLTDLPFYGFNLN